MTDSHPDAAPFSIEARPDLTGGVRVGVLVSHGFTGSPISVAPWARHLAEQGCGVRVPRLPGHGTTWQQLNTMRWPDWYGEIQRAADELTETHDVVAVAGLSMGGALALRLAADRPHTISSVSIVNPALASKRLDIKLLPVLKHLVPAFPGIANDIKAEGVEEYGYTKTPLKAIHSFMQEWPSLIADLPRVVAPLLLFRSTEDHVVDEKSRPIILHGVRSTEIIDRELTDSYHVATLDNDAPAIFAESAEFILRHAGVGARSTG